MPEDPPVERLQVVTLQPGDLLVATVKGHIDQDQADRIKARLTAKVPAGVEVVVVNDQIELAGWRPEP
jgi:hypothetical protein